MNEVHALAIDDNLENLRVLVQMLRKQGVICTAVSDPRTLDDVLASLSAVDIVFLDLEMRHIDGYSVKDQLRVQIGNRPIIAYTVHISQIRTVQASGFDGFLGKPLDGNRFPDQLARILRGESVWDRNL